MKFHIITLGCQMNISDSERVCTVLNRMGFEQTDDENEAILVGVLACSVRQKAIDKVYSLIHKWEQRKKHTPLITFISGCILPLDREKFLKRFDILFSINELPQLPAMLQQYGISTPYSVNAHDINTAMSDAPTHEHIHTSLENNIAINADETFSDLDIQEDNTEVDFWKIAPSYSSEYEAFVSIQNGCDKFCTFCAVPYTRGREISRNSSEIIQEVYALIQKGYKSITLLGQNVNSYGLDMKGTELRFAQLLDRIGNLSQMLNHKCWIYFTSPHPRDMTKDVLEIMAKYPCIAKQIHLPLQSGDDKLLMKMNRAHSMVKYDNVVRDILSIVPEATLFTDIIVGFCGETEAQFQNTVEAMKKYRYSMAYIAMYSPRPGAASARWKDDIPMEEKKRRFRILSDIMRDTCQAVHKKFIGKTITLLVDKVNPLKDPHDDYAPIMLSAKTEGKVPTQVKIPISLWKDIDAEIFKAQVVGTFIEAKVVDLHSLSLITELHSIPPERIEIDSPIIKEIEV